MGAHADQYEFSGQIRYYLFGALGEHRVQSAGCRYPADVGSIPDGKYRLRAAVGNIQQNGANSTVNAGEKQTGVTLYAGDL